MNTIIRWAMLHDLGIITTILTIAGVPSSEVKKIKEGTVSVINNTSEASKVSISDYAPKVKAIVYVMIGAILIIGYFLLKHFKIIK
jgi:hypothetical protein